MCKIKPHLYVSIFIICSLLISQAVMGNIINGKKVDPKLIVEWNNLTYKIAYEHDKFYSFIGIRALTMTHLAIHDALNSIDKRYAHYEYHKSLHKEDGTLLVSYTAATILTEIYPDRADTIQQVLNRWVKTVDREIDQTMAKQSGEEIAMAYIELRKNDGHQKQGDYTPMTKPGDYQYTPGWNNWVLKPDFDYATPFAMENVTQFRSPPPPDLKSEVYARSYQEVKSLGGKKSKARTPDQTHIAHWWAEFGEHSWNRIGRILSLDQGLDAWETARLFALINMDIYEIYLASLESKYFYDTWRPLTAVQGAENDGNAGTKTDLNWEPEMLTPPWPEYPSAHAAVGAGGATVVTAVFGTSKLTFSMESTSAIGYNKTRTYHDMNKAAEDCAASRIYNGYHFRFATEEGLDQGKKIAHFILNNFLTPVK